MVDTDLFEAELGTAPCNEPCGQSGYANWSELQKMECEEHAAQIVRENGPLPIGASFKAKRNPYEDMAYYELIYKCPYEDEVGVAYGQMLESNGPLNWDARAIDNLNKKGYFDLLTENQKGNKD